MATTRSHKKLKHLLKADPNICLIRTPAGLYRVYKAWFDQLCKLPWLRRTAPRVARVADGYSVIISDREFHAYESKRPPVGPHLPTFSQLIERAWIYKVESRSYSPAERQEAATRNYALYCVMEAV